MEFMRSVGRLLIFDVTAGESFAQIKVLLDLDKNSLQGNPNNGRRFLSSATPAMSQITFKKIRLSVNPTRAWTVS
jgi:hypothetical protein